MSIEESRERLKQAEKEIRADQDRQSLYSLKEIEAAMRAKGFESSAKLVLAELTRPRPTFAEGQVVYSGAIYLKWRDSFNRDSCRPLTLTEHGPAVKALRDAVAGWLQANTSGGWLDLKEALDAFDSEISDD